MTFRGKVQGKVVIPEEGATLEDGAEVLIETAPAPEPETGPQTTLGQRLLKYAGAAEGLPSDMARNHDHYIHGTPKK